MINKRLLLAVAVALMNVAPASAQSGASLSASTNPFHRHRPLEEGDSVAVFRALRSRQLAFERFRRENFPVAEVRQRVECDDIIGRFCYTHAEPLENQGPEPEMVTAARTTLIAALDSGAAWHPASEWITAQRIRYLVESGQYDRALALSEDCRVRETWRCYALAGYVQHSGARFAAAEAFFDQALAAMPEETRCEWTDLRSILPDEIRADYPADSTDSCGERATVNKRIWWLADPLYLIPGNERRTEHFSRQVLNWMLQRSESALGIWETDMGQLINRYGWPTQWANVMVGRNETWRENAIVARHSPFSRHFIPTPRVYQAPTSARWFEWPLDLEGARTRYAPSYASTFDYLEQHQAVSFRRADSSLVVAAFEWEWEGMPDTVQMEWATVLSASDSTPLNIESGRGSNTRVATIMSGDTSPSVVSLEAISRAEVRAARVRFGISPPARPDGGIVASEILLFEPTTPLPLELTDVAQQAMTSNQIRTRGSVGLYWELYGLTAETDSLTTSVTVVREGRSFFRGLAQGIGLAGPRRPEVTIDWTEPTGRGAFALPYSVSVELGDLRPGTYQIRVEAVSSAGARALSEKQIEVVE